MTDLDRWRRKREHQLRALEQLVVFGFFTKEYSVRGRSVVLKTVTEEDAKHSSDVSELLARSIFSVDGVVLYDPRMVSRDFYGVFELVGHWSGVTYTCFEEFLGWSRNFMAELTLAYEEFLESNESRDLWSKYQFGIYPLDVPWEPRIVTTGFQVFWRQFNQIQDRRDEHEVLWTMLRFVIASWNGELAKKLPDTFYKRLVQNVVENALIPPVRTARDLVDQLERMSRGEEDEHDRIVREIEQQVLEEENVRQAEIEREMNRRKELSDDQLIGVDLEVVEDDA